MLYLLATEPLPHEPLWTVYALPVIRPSMLLATALLVAALVLLLVTPRVSRE